MLNFRILITIIISMVKVSGLEEVRQRCIHISFQSTKKLISSYKHAVRGLVKKSG